VRPWARFLDTHSEAAHGHPLSAFLDPHSTPRSALGIRTQCSSDCSSTACSLHVDGFRTPTEGVQRHHRVKLGSVEAPANLPRGFVRCGGQRARTWRAAHVHEWHALGPYASVGVHASHALGVR
jgi:hypothetical protein